MSLLHGRVSAIVTFQSGELGGSDPVCEGLGRKLCSVIKPILWTNRINVRSLKFEEKVVGIK